MYNKFYDSPSNRSVTLNAFWATDHLRVVLSFLGLLKDTEL
jgi:hypothetical protein